MEGPPLGPGGEDITWPDRVAPRGRKASSTRKIKPQISNRILPLLLQPCTALCGGLLQLTVTLWAQLCIRTASQTCWDAPWVLQRIGLH